MNTNQAFAVGQAVELRWTIGEAFEPGVVERRELVDVGNGQLWVAASQYWVRRIRDGALLNFDLVDAHRTAGGMVRAAA